MFTKIFLRKTLESELYRKDIKTQLCILFAITAPICTSKNLSSEANIKYR